MTSYITTQMTSDKTADIQGNYVIEENTTTRKILRATVVDNPRDPDACVSCTILHQRKSPKDKWEDVESINLNTLKAGEGVKLNLGCTQTKNLKKIIDLIYGIGAKGVHNQQLVIAKKDDVIIPQGRELQYIKKLIDMELTEDIWTQLVEKNPNIITKLSYARIQSERTKVLAEFETSLNQDHNESYWQDYFGKNEWIFGYGLSFIYVSKLSEQGYLGGKSIYNKGGRNVDYIYQSAGNSRFFSLIEIKKPSTQLLEQSPTRNGCFSISKELSSAIAQIQGYLDTICRNSSEERFTIEENNSAIFAHPRGIIVIGNSSELSDRDRRRSFAIFRESIQGVDIITFDELLERAKMIVSNNTPKNVNDLTAEIDDDSYDLPF